GEHIVEIGPGQGALTFALLDAMTGNSRLSLLELDRDLVALLQPRLQNYAQVELLQADALQYDFSQLAAAGAASPPLRVVGNLPYNISTPLLFHLLQQRSADGAQPLFRDMHFMLQKEVVQRICAAPGSKQYGRLSVMTQYLCDVEQLFLVPPAAFRPAPKVESAIVRLLPFAQPPAQAQNFAQFETLVKAAFSQRRKTLKNNWRGLVDEKLFQQTGIDPRARAETLAVADFVAISNALGNGLNKALNNTPKQCT
ncbi:MAG: 16S rRNA (adenine(1518)-N(6)/adenine(1519)-N(6))-dimethyltransferase RsmA, partial [Gammaproteobacteria bacterium]|nr:16S rRNA (adenine(1518)-N(6)/adenine(1519)-N(6))-dimethyltransferase RsmA [Gammaproteobacteria bacterium]